MSLMLLLIQVFKMIFLISQMQITQTMKKENRRAVLFFCLIYPKMLRSQPKGVQRLLVLPSRVGRTERIWSAM